MNDLHLALAHELANQRLADAQRHHRSRRHARRT
jgi:hypothetical protein